MKGSLGDRIRKKIEKVGSYLSFSGLINVNRLLSLERQ